MNGRLGPIKNDKLRLDNAGAEFNAFVGKLGDILVKALDRPLGYAINWGRFGHSGPCTLKQDAAV